MKLNMNESMLSNILEIKEFIKLNKSKLLINEDTILNNYNIISNTLFRFRYDKLVKKEKNILKLYLKMITNYSDGNINKLISKWKVKGEIVVKERTQNTFPRKYFVEDIYRLVEVSNLYNNQNAKALIIIFKNMYGLYGDERFVRLKDISASHIYNLKKTNIFKSNTLLYTKTSPSRVDVGLRVKPENAGKPGYLRVDSVHQGDLDKVKGVYHITIVDEVTQVTFLDCVPFIREEYMLIVLKDLIKMFPFPVINFHSDNGSEYINYSVSKILTELNISQTKSRPRQSGDNGLVESKNGSIVRKQMGYMHIPSRHAYKINEFYKKYLNDFNNYHRVSGYATDTVDKRGKVKKVYDIYQTPIDKLLSLNLPFVDNQKLKKKQLEYTHLEHALLVKEAKSKLFKEILN
jgi:hypothetical protein